ncbi:butanediol dehydrogenase [Staphylococcus haemolyticus]|uniref:2,3-butanediol dehydrogenase n=1 Tax=Staphylococcus haemolyticus TaxID=1283 RepID=UPI000C26A82F|nr:2,3-butanediol dehydrogenase [Staphylococcus haemolyticus]PJM59360.1 butanediol dehydrogenase [Staphylococcus haemolyticus]
MKAAVWYGQKDVRVEDREPKQLKDNEVKVKVSWAGICGTDLHEYLEGPVFISTDKPDPLLGQKAPVTLGHEFAGVVEEVGKDVTKYKKGDRVVVNPTVSKHEKDESVDLYDGYSFIGLGSDGGFAEFTNAPEENVYALPESVSDKEGALVEPTAVAVQAVKEGKLLFGDTVAVFGAGPIGLLTIVAAKAAGASKILVFDLSEERLAKAKEVGATHVVNSGNTNPVDFINEHTENGVDVTFEVAGVGVTLSQSVQVTRPRGTVVIVSIFAHAVDFDPMLLTNSGVQLTSTIAYSPTTFQQTIDLIANGSLDVKSVVTDEIELENIVESGFEQLVNDKSQAKILVKLNG